MTFEKKKFCLIKTKIEQVVYIFNKKRNFRLKKIKNMIV